MRTPRLFSFPFRFWNRLVPCLLGLLICSCQLVLAQELHLTLGDESRIRIEGTSSVNTFDCEAGVLEGSGQLFRDARPGHRSVVADVRVPVRQFDCGNPRMNADLQETLQAHTHPQIRFQLRDARLASSEGSSTQFTLDVSGWLEIAGNARPVELRVDGRRWTDTSYHATGKVPLRMSDFGIDPPVALLGLVKVRDQITVHFDLIAIHHEHQYINTRR